MQRISGQIMKYSVFVPEEKQGLDAYVVEHPELVQLLEEVKGWSMLRKEEPDVPREKSGVLNEALAYYVVTRRMSAHHPLPEPLRDLFAGLEARIAADPALRARVEALTRRLEE